jgi:glucose-6-phosphate isomerase
MNESSPFTIGDQMLIMIDHEQAIRSCLGHMDSNDFTNRFWAKDGRLWNREENDPDITGTMGWIFIAETMKQRIPELQKFAAEIKAAGFERAVLAGMGGSSLAPLVLAETLYTKGKGIPVEVLDSTDPATVLRIQRGGPLEKTLFLIASKSGSTAEPTAYDEYFYDQVSKLKSNPGENFVAITDPGTDLEKTATARNFRHTFRNFADIGGRFSALTYFGMVPAALMEIDLEKLLGRAIDVIAENNGKKASECPALVLGATLGTLANLKIDKCTFWVPDALSSVGLWLEQLIAESTGKEQKGILPVAGETPGTPSEYGADRVFAYLRPREDDCTYLDARMATLRDADKPIVWITVNDNYDIAREFMRWELATAVAGSIIGINPFNQPNVQEAKDVTKTYVANLEKEGSLPSVKPDAEADGLTIYGSVKGDTLAELIFSFFADQKSGDFATIQAYLTESPKMTEALAKLQACIRDCTMLATTKGYGPRFLHSTGQFHKGGPNGGHFIQLTQDIGEDVPLPGRSYTFGLFRNAQVLGDHDTLVKHDRRVIRIHLGADPLGGVQKLTKAVESKPLVAHA